MTVDRFSITMDPELGKAVREAAAAEGMSVSAWIAESVAHRVRQNLLGEALDAWEAEHGAFTQEELAAADAFIEDAQREAKEKAAEIERRRRAEPAA